MFSESILAANLAALERAQGQRPNFAALDPERVRAVPDEAVGLRLELRTAEGAWLPFDGPSTAGFPKQLFVVGPALGAVLDLIERDGAPTRVVVLEPDPGVAVLMLARRDWIRWIDGGRLQILTGPDYRGAYGCARYVDVSEPPSVIASPLLAHHRPAEVAAAQAVAARIISEANANADARRRFAGRYLLQALGNVPVIAREGNAAALEGLFAGLPAVVVGAGPSLDENLPALARLQNRAVVIAADTTLRPLLRAGVRPHLMVGVDPGEMNARHLAGVADSADIFLAAEGSLHPPAFESFTGRTFVFKVSDHEPWPWLRARHLDRGKVRAWGSVVTSAFDLALRMGCDPVVFAGLDLAFTGMRPYCNHTIYHEMWQSYVDAGCPWELVMAEYFSKQPDVRMSDIRGQEVRTAPSLVSFRNWLIEQIAAEPKCRFINATGGGILHGTSALIQGTLDGALASSPSLGDRVSTALHAQHGRFGFGGAAMLRRDLEGLLNADAATIEQLDRWRTFTANTVSHDEIRSRIAEVARAL